MIHATIKSPIIFQNQTGLVKISSIHVYLVYQSLCYGLECEQKHSKDKSFSVLCYLLPRLVFDESSIGIKSSKLLQMFDKMSELLEQGSQLMLYFKIAYTTLSWLEMGQQIKKKFSLHLKDCCSNYETFCYTYCYFYSS